MRHLGTGHCAAVRFGNTPIDGYRTQPETAFAVSVPGSTIENHAARSSAELEHLKGNSAKALTHVLPD